jgi:hypothetical protein
MNNLYKSLGQNQLPAPFGNMQNLIKQFNQFRNTFRGDPKQQVQELLNSGRMTQEQFNNLKKVADQLQGMLK